MENEIDGEKVPFDEIFTHRFMRRQTDAESIDEFFENSPWQPETPEEFDAIPVAELDRYVDEHSRFRTWEGMKSKAGNEWVKQKLNF